MFLVHVLCYICLVPRPPALISAWAVKTLAHAPGQPGNKASTSLSLFVLFSPLFTFDLCILFQSFVAFLLYQLPPSSVVSCNRFHTSGVQSPCPCLSYVAWFVVVVLLPSCTSRVLEIGGNVEGSPSPYTLLGVILTSPHAGPQSRG